jgi:hypothetical protein
VIRKVTVCQEYFADFYKAPDKKVLEKIRYVLDLVRFERQVPRDSFKYLKNTDGIYEARVTRFISLILLIKHIIEDRKPVHQLVL